MSFDAPTTEVNARFWRDGAAVTDYDGAQLSPAESLLLEQYQEPLRGRVLELGPGAGRVTQHLAQRAAAVIALELSPTLAEACRARVPSATVAVRDMQDLDEFPDGAFDAVVASNNVIDVLDDRQRRALLLQLRRVLAAGGVLIFSTHNRDSPVRRPSHEFRLLHYNITALVQRRQLAGCGLTVEACMSDDGEAVDIDGASSTAPFLHYAARR